MDNVLVDFQSGIDRISPELRLKFEEKLDEVPTIFRLMDPLVDAISSIEILSKHFDTYILSTAPWKNPSAWSDKLEWVQKHFPEIFYKRLILTHHKDLCKGDFLVDDRTKNGAGEFSGELVHFGTEKFPDWNAVTEYLLKKI